jgi:glycosyltransferase involved in cell wall biosynthesis/SAM-dependent methyltransferase
MTRFPLDIIFMTAGMPFDGHTIKTKSLGGSESAAYYMARALAKRGHRVRHFTNTEKVETVDGVTYMPISNWGPYTRDAHHDISIIQRNPQAMAHAINAKLSILWCHDLALRRNNDVVRATKWRTDKTFLLSQFHADQYKEVVGYEDEEIYITRNGFDFTSQPLPAPHAERDPHLYVYAARPERGLENVLTTVLPGLLKMDPQAKLAVCTYDNVVPEMVPFYDHIKRLAEGLPVQFLGALTKPQLYQLLNSAIAYLYPTPGPEMWSDFREISCIAAIEAQACGLPFIHTGAGALAETLPDLASTRTTVEGMAQAAFDLASSPGLWTAAQRTQLDHVRRYDWDVLAGEWEIQFVEWLLERNSSPSRLAQWFYRRSEIEGVRECIRKAKEAGKMDAMLIRLEAEVEQHYWFTDSEDKLALHYNTMGQGITIDLNSRRDVFDLAQITNNPEPRFHAIGQILQESGVKTLFDAGCGHGWSSLFFANNLGLSVIGYDVDAGACEWARQLRDQTNKDAKAHFFSEWSKASYFASKTHPEGLDAVLCSEVLEHVVDPNAFIDRAEQFVKPGGLVVCTVPFGPWEFDGPNWHGLGRTHIRELSQHCIYEMFGHKPGFKCGAVRTAQHATLGDPLGFYLFTWNADHLPTRKRNMARLLQIQRPVESLSVNIIAGPGAEKTIRWTLDSVRSIADEIIVGDTGMSDQCKAACADYGAVIVPAPNPLTDGFSAARNTVLDASCGDWVLWIDTDERLIEPENLRQYLRRNNAKGYAMRQIHAAVDDQIGNDTPVRLFRKDSNCRFIGLIHEHPEAGLNKGPGNVCILGGFPAIWHMGYENNAVRGKRFIRNRPLVIRDRQENPERALGIYLDARDNILMMNEWLTRNNGVPNDHARAHAERVLELCAQYEAKNIPLMGIGVDLYKSDALRVLGRGFDATVNIAVQRDGIGDPGKHPLRFADEADLKEYIARLISGKLERITGSYW